MLTPVTYLSKPPGILTLAALLQLELFRLMPDLPTSHCHCDSTNYSGKSCGCLRCSRHFYFFCWLTHENQSSRLCGWRWFPTMELSLSQLPGRT
ncbi:hypothetical protein CI789_15595 [Erwinia persicina]|nr:hypothetical protein CI789_15595 [Erwinia persicina]